MRKQFLEFLACPECAEALTLSEHEGRDGEEIERGLLKCAGGHAFPIRKGLPRFVESDAPVRNFSFEWRLHRKTQVDRFSGLRESEKKFRSQLDVPLGWLKGKRVLDVGCGSGRFSDVALRAGAEVVGVDLSFAVDAARENLKGEPRFHLAQADVFRLPFRAEVFDLVFSFGVLHHTANAREAFFRLPRLVKPGGKLAVCLYSGYERALVLPGNALRSVLRRLPPRLLYALCYAAVPLYFLYRIPGLGHLGKMIFNISMHPNRRWRVLDTYDWYSPRYQSAHTHYEVFRWFTDAGLEKIQVLEPGVSLLGHKPCAASQASFISTRPDRSIALHSNG